jgi:hypothetical protein
MCKKPAIFTTTSSTASLSYRYVLVQEQKTSQRRTGILNFRHFRKTVGMVRMMMMIGQR